MYFIGVALPTSLSLRRQLSDSYSLTLRKAKGSMSMSFCFTPYSNAALHSRVGSRGHERCTPPYFLQGDFFLELYFCSCLFFLCIYTKNKSTNASALDGRLAEKYIPPTMRYCPAWYWPPPPHIPPLSCLCA